MKVERFKMIYITKIKKDLEKGLEHYNNHALEEIRNGHIRILGHDFARNNKNKAKLIIANKKYKLKEFINEKYFTDNKIKLNILFSNDLSNISHMFENCIKLREIFDKTDYDNSLKSIESIEETHDSDYYINDDDLYSIDYKIKIIDEEQDNSIMEHIKDKLMNYQDRYYLDLSSIFSNCLSLSSLPDISKWNTNNVNDIYEMLRNCISLSSLPDITKWNTNKIRDMENMNLNCYNCLLLYLPDKQIFNESSESYDETDEIENLLF